MGVNLQIKINVHCPFILKIKSEKKHSSQRSIKMTWIFI